jgi:hypothetical protein
MNRTDALTYLQNGYDEYSAEASWDATKVTQVSNTVIDQSLRQLGVMEDDLPTADIEGTEIVSYQALLDYFMLDRLVRTFALRTDVSVSGISSRQSQTFTFVWQLREDAGKRCAGLGISPAQSMSAGYFTLDFLEPITEGVW